MTSESEDTHFLPGRHLLEAYGNGGFRFGGMSHRGSILALPSGVRAWPVRGVSEIDEAALAPIIAEAEAIEILLLGTGDQPAFIEESVRASFGGGGHSPRCHADRGRGAHLQCADRRGQARRRGTDRGGVKRTPPHTRGPYAIIEASHGKAGSGALLLRFRT